MRRIARAVAFAMLSLAFAPAPFPKSGGPTGRAWRIDLRPLAEAPSWCGLTISVWPESKGEPPTRIELLVRDGAVLSAWAVEPAGDRDLGGVAGLPPAD